MRLFEIITDIIRGFLPQSKYDFTFELNDDRYGAYTDENGVLSIDLIEYDILRGYIASCELPDDNAVDVALDIYRRAAKNPKKYPLGSKHYNTRIFDNGEKYTLRVKPDGRIQSNTFGKLAAILTCVFLTACVLLFLDIGFTNVLRPAFIRSFPSLSENTLNLFLTVFLFTAFVSAYFSSKASICAYYSLGLFAPIFTASTVVERELSDSSSACVFMVISVAICSLDFIFSGTFGRYLFRKSAKFVLKACVLLLAAAFILCLLSSGGDNNESQPITDNEYQMFKDTVTDEYYEATDAIRYTSWNKMPNERKLDILQKIAAYESVFTLGIPIPKVITAELGEGILGKAVYSDNTIRISDTHLEQAGIYYILQTLLHELRHMWQHRATQLLSDIPPDVVEKYSDFYVIKDFTEYKENLLNYIDHEESEKGYYSQPVETDSRRWADEMMKENYYYIKESDDSGEAVYKELN